jgi:hypothetical protein
LNYCIKVVNAQWSSYKILHTKILEVFLKIVFNIVSMPEIRRFKVVLSILQYTGLNPWRALHLSRRQFSS